MRGFYLALLIAIGAGTAPIAPAAAASFTCSGVKDPLERRVCQDPQLSRADESLAAAYWAILKGSSSEGQKLLRQSQRGWLLFVRRRCNPAGKPLDQWRYIAEPGKDAATSCLREHYRARLIVLRRSRFRVGGHDFLIVHSYRLRLARPDEQVSQEGADEWAFAIEETEIPRVDPVRTESERVWNRATMSWLADGLSTAYDPEAGERTFETSSTNADIRVSVDSASPDAIAASMEISAYSRGAAHPQYWGQSHLWSLRLNRQLSENDILRAPAKAKQALGALVASRLEDWRGDRIDESCRHKSVDFTLSSARITHRGVRSVYHPYELGGYLCYGESSLTWGELQPYLRHELPLVPAQLEDSPSSGRR
jgi:uncharacterized protein YecT (DUF1311 family)